MPVRPLRSWIAAWGPFVLSAALAALGVRLALRDPVLAALLAIVIALLLLPGARERRRVRRRLQSGDVRIVMAAWSESFARVPYPETLGPLMAATAFASCGWVEQARTALGRAARGPVWEAALEHRLFVETILHTFEGDREASLEKAARLSALPLPVTGPFAAGRVRTLREALGALARAFAHVSRRGDLALLEHAAEKNPLVFWPLRYAAAIVAVDGGDLGRARRLLSSAPSWPEGTVFHSFHAEIAPRVGLPAPDAAGAAAPPSAT